MTLTEVVPWRDLTNNNRGDMARKKSSGGWLALLGVGLVIWLVSKYGLAMLIVGGLAGAAWVAYRLYFGTKQEEAPAPIIEREPRLPAARKSFYESQSRESPGKVTSRNGDEFWVPPTRSVDGPNRPIGGGLYYGSGLSAVESTGVEPAQIDPKLPVDRTVTDCAVRRLGYWSSYPTASPEARAGYLNWLATGRKNPNADLGYVFLYFYGLERRALYDAHVSAAAKADLPWVVSEVERLLAIYGRSGSFQNYAGSLRDLLKNQVVGPRMYASAPEPVVPGHGLDLSHRIALGQCAKDGAPLPADWAFAWLVADPTTRLRTPAARCPDEFKALFFNRYAVVFGSGMALPRNKTQLKFERRAASPSFELRGQGHVLQFDLPDVSVLTSPVKKLQEVAEWCYPKLDSYSRYVRKEGANKESFDAILELPLALWPVQYRKVIENARVIVSKGQRPVAIPFEKFKSWFPAWESVTKTKLQSLYRVLAEAGLGMEPDVRFGGALPSAAAPVVLFADDATTSSPKPSARYTAAALTLQLGAAVALADGDPNDIEKGLMTRQLEEWLHLSESERRRLHAFTRFTLAQPPKLSGIKAKVEALDVKQRAAIGDFLALIAQADATVTPAEIKTLEKSFKLLGLDAQQVYSKVHVAATEPVTVRSAEGTEGHRIPKPKTVAQSGIKLDPARIAELQRDTERVSAILGAIFASATPEPEEPVPAEVEPVATTQPTLLGLPVEQSAFVQTLLARPQWTRAELQELADDREFMLDGVLERINEASFDKYEKPLLEGDEVVDVNPEVLRELLQ